MSKSAKLIRLSPTMAQIYLYPYGHIEIHDNGGEVNVSWSYIQGLDLELRGGIRIERFSLGYSIPYNADMKDGTLGLNIKNAIDTSIAEVLGLDENQSNSILTGTF